MSSVKSQSMMSPVQSDSFLTSSAADPIPTFVLKQTVDLLAPFVTELFNRSLAAGHFPGRFKDAFITPIVKKAGFDATEACSSRPMYNLPVLSKLLERLVVRQLMNYLTSFDLLPPLQSGFRPGHSTESAVLHVLSDALLLSTAQILLRWLC